MSFLWLALPAVLFLFIAVAHALLETSENYTIPVYAWKKINWKPFVVVLLLFPVV